MSSLSPLVTSDQFSRPLVTDSATPWTSARQASLSITNSWSLLKLMSNQSVIPFNHLISSPRSPKSQSTVFNIFQIDHVFGVCLQLILVMHAWLFFSCSA